MHGTAEIPLAYESLYHGSKTSIDNPLLTVTLMHLKTKFYQALMSFVLLVVVQGDFNDANILLGGKYQISGVINFRDSTYR